jgi:hypothetical protein
MSLYDASFNTIQTGINISHRRGMNIPSDWGDHMFEHRTKPLLPRREFALRILRSLGFSLGIIGGSLLIGIWGYHFLEDLSWIDSLLNSSMILAGMGPVNALHTVNGKLFASFYALFSGVIFITSVAVLLSPIVHRFLHRFHLEDEGP